jgi:glyoxylase-like metal-dependent hydrolase (beta-lactamase superfamily II)
VNVAEPWFVREQHADGITKIAEPHVHRIIRCNVWHVRGRDRDLVIDTSVGVASVAQEIADLLDKPTVCVATHIHYDHVGCLHEFDIRLMHPIAADEIDP